MVVQTPRTLALYLCCPFGISIKNLVSCFSWGFPGFSGRFSKEEEVGRSRNTQISHLYSSVVSSFASNLPVISGIVNPSCLGTGNLHSCLAALEQNSKLRVAPPRVWNVVRLLVAPSLVLLFPRDIFVDKRLPPPGIQLFQMDMRHIFPVAL